MKKKYKNILILVILISFLIIYFISIDTIIIKIIDYTILFFKKIFPVSFIFLTLSNLLIEYNLIQILQRLFRIKSPYIYVFILSLISGFPSGAIYIKELLEKEIISIKDANKLIMFSHFPNPLFVINSIGYILNSKVSALIILLSIIVSNSIIMLFCCKHSNNTFIKFNYNNRDFSDILSNTVYKTIKTIVLIYGLSLFFYLISIIINNLFNNIYIYVFISGVFDLTYGVYSTKLLSNNIIKGLLIMFFISFGPISIHFQTKSILANTHVNYKKYLIGRIIGCLISIIFFYSVIKLKLNVPFLLEGITG